MPFIADMGFETVYEVQPSVLRKQLSDRLDVHLPVHMAQIDSNYKHGKLQAKSMSAFFAKSSLDKEFSDHILPTLIVGLLYFKNNLDVDKVRHILYERLVSVFIRFRSIVKMDSKGKVSFHKLELKDVDMTYHVQPIEATGWTQINLDEFLTKLYTEKKSLDDPLWNFYILNNLADNRSLLVANIDHTLGDGVAMVEVLLSLLDDRDSVVPPPSNAAVQISSINQSTSLSAIDRAATVIKGVLLGLGSPILNQLLGGDMANCLKMKNHRIPSSFKACSFADSIPLTEIKEIRGILPGTTVNDILAAVLNMCVRRYLEEKLDPIISNNGLCRANFPVNLRPKGFSVRDTIGNRFAIAGFRFKFDYTSRVALVWDVKRQIDEIKLSPQPLIELKILEALEPILPAHALINAIHDSNGAFTLMMSNVAGPMSEARFVGQAIDTMSFMALGSIGVYCGLLSYNGTVSLTVSADAETVKVPKELTKHWKHEFEALLAEARSMRSTPIKVPKYSSLPSFLIVAGTAGLLVAVVTTILSCFY